MKCTYKYQGEVYQSIDDVYPILLANLESKDNLFQVNNTRATESFEPTTKAVPLPTTNKQTFTVKKAVKVVINPNNKYPSKVSFIIKSDQNPNFNLYAIKSTANKYNIVTTNGHVIGQDIEKKEGIEAYLTTLSDNLYSLSDEDKNRIGYNDTQKQLETIASIEAMGKDVVLDGVLGKYINIETGKQYERVSNMIAGKDITLNDFGETAVMFGNVIDRIFRDVMNDNLTSYEDYKTTADTLMFKSKEAFNNFVLEANVFKQDLLRRGEKIVTNNGQDIVLYDNESGVAGAVDLLTVDTYGVPRIYDYKSMKGNRFVKTYEGEAVPKIESTKFGMSSLVRYTKQQSYYKTLFEKMFNIPVANISLVPVELNEYGVTDTSINYAEVKPLVQLDPMSVSLEKVRPEITVPTVAEFFETFVATPQQTQEATDYINQSDIRTFKIHTPDGTSTVILTDEDGDNTIYTVKNLMTGKKMLFKDEVIKLLEPSLAYDNLRKLAEDSIESNTVNNNTPITVNLPATQEDIDTFIETALPIRTLDNSFIKDNKDFIYDYVTGDRITPNELPSLLDRFTDNTKNVAQKELLRLVIDNVKAFNSLPIIIDSNLTGRGVLTFDPITKETNGIRINPNLIKNPEAFKTVVLEELAHALSYRALRESNNDHAQRLETLRRTAIEMFGAEKMVELGKARIELNNLKIKRSADALTAEEQERYDYLANDKDMAIQYRLATLDEFTVGLFLSANLQEFLNGLNIEDAKDKKVKSLWDKIIDLISSLFSNYNPMLKYGLYDAISIFEKSAKDFANNPELLDVVGAHRKTTSEVNNLFNLRDVNNNLNKIENGQEVADFININIHNIIAEYDKQSNTVNTIYRDSVSLSSGENADGIITDTPNRLERENDFTSKIKSYIINLKQRENTLHTQINKEFDQSLMTNEEYQEFAVKRNNLIEELQTVRDLRKNVVGKGDINVNNLYRLSEQAFGELDNIRRFMTTNMNEADLLYSFQTVKFWLKARDLMFDAVDITDEGAIARFNDVEKKAKLIEGDLIKSLNKWVMTDIVGKNTSYQGSLDALLKNTKDLDGISAQVADLSVINSPLAQALGKIIKENDVNLSKERSDKLRRFEDLLKNAKSSLKHYANGKDGFEIFRQLDDQGRKTRNIVSRFSNKYQQERKVLNFVYTSQDKTKEEAYIAFKFLKDSTEAINLELLFPMDDVITDEGRAELDRVKSLLGDKYFSEWLNKQSKYIKSYKQDRMGYVISLEQRLGIKEADFANNEAATNAMGIWENRNSPYRLSEKLNRVEPIKANPFSMAKGYNSFKYIVEVPKKQLTDKKGIVTDSAYYDSKFERIENDSTLNALYDEMQNILQYVGKLVPFNSAEHLSHGQLPEFQKSMYEALIGNMGRGLKTVNEALVDMVRTERFNSSPELDIVTGKDQRNIRLGIRKTDSLISRDITSARLDHYATTGRNLNAQEEINLKSEITAKYAEEMDFNLGNVFNMYLQLGLAYEYKAKIENGLLLSQMMLEEQKEYKRDNKKQLIQDKSFAAYVKYEQKDAADSFLNQKKVIDHTFNSVLYGDKRNINSTKNKIYTLVEKSLKKKYEEQIKSLDTLLSKETINKEEHTIFKAKLEKYIDELGAYGDAEKFVDIPIKITQYTGMGWNVLGGISNMMFGTVSNVLESAGEEFYTQSDLMDAYKTVLQHSTLRNATFNKVGTDEAIKIRSLMDTYDIMAESSKEYVDLIGDDLTSNLKFASAFNMNQRTEYINQAPLMLVMMRKTAFTHDGKEYKLYEGFNKDGTWNTDNYGEYPTELINKTVLKIKALVQRNHGNYNPLAPMLAKRSGVGRLLMQFRSWMVDGYRVRFGDRYGRTDEIFETEVRGRYHSLVDVMRDDWKGVSLPMVKQILYNFIPFKANMGIKTTPITSYFEGKEGVRAVDIANMKRVAMEINILIGVYVTGMLLSLLADELDDDDPKKMMITMLLNQSGRLRTDILMYANPNEAAKLIQDPVPALKIIGNVGGWFDAVNKTLQGSPDYESGIFEGHNRILKATATALPFFSQPYRTATSMMQEFK